MISENYKTWLQNDLKLISMHDMIEFDEFDDNEIN